MNYLLRLTLLSLFLAGCAAPPSAPPSLPVDRVVPQVLNLDSMRAYAGLEQQFALGLVSHYLSAPAYRMSNPLSISRHYRVAEAERSPDGSQLAVSLYDAENGRWALVTAAVGSNAVMNAFDVVHKGEQGYALVLKRVRFCLVEGADQPPLWGGQGWLFSHTRPGRFECSGQTNGSLFQPYSGMPGALGVYFESGDTVLFDRRWPVLKQLAGQLSSLFPQLRVPQIN